MNVYCQPEDRQGKPSLIHVDRVIHRQAEEGPSADEAPPVAPPSSPPSPRTPRAGPVTRAQTRRTAGAVQVSWAEEVEREEEEERQRQRARQEEEDWLEEYAILARPSSTPAPDSQSLGGDSWLTVDSDTPSEGNDLPSLAPDDPRQEDPWYRLGDLIWGERPRTRSRGPVADVPLPKRCHAYRPRKGGDPRK